jgi:hypothetical protein
MDIDIEGPYMSGAKEKSEKTEVNNIYHLIQFMIHLQSIYIYTYILCTLLPYPKHNPSLRG